MTDKKYKKELTQEQIEEFWEWCGFEIKKESWIDDHYEPDGRLLTPKGKVYDGVCVFGYPLVDLNNLFKYAVPEVAKEIGWIKTKELLKNWISYLYTDQEQNLWRLFWAIWEVRNVKISCMGLRCLRGGWHILHKGRKVRTSRRR